MNATIHSVLFLTAPARRNGVVFADAAEHHDVLRRHEQNDQEREEGCLECAELAKRRLVPAREDGHADHQQGEHHSVEEDGQRLELVEDE